MLMLFAKLLGPYHDLHYMLKLTSAQLEQFCTGIPCCCSRVHLQAHLHRGGIRGQHEQQWWADRLPHAAYAGSIALIRH
jgi:hypothetical protein